MMKEFDMTDLGLLHYFLGLQIVQADDGIFISQKRYALELLKKYNMLSCKTFSTPMNTNEKLVQNDGTTKANEKVFRGIVGGLMYLTHSRPDIMYSVNVISRFMNNPSVHHLGAAKRILRYIRETTNYGIWYKSVSNFHLVGFTDSDWAGSIEDDWAGSIEDRAQVDSYSILGLEQYPGAQRSKQVLHCHLQKLNILQLHRQHVKQFG
ncbi:putative mitochondrial protein [Dendrobium catenatum]|uniref:Putative mitochondrial protein n=1 Tax=Dendrobium catenatum TaxID=906689 RepID=A0A2I0WTM4_9ASPA|nr:putative mitochondrial protein [Dendrobium catenatum]